MLFRSIHNPNHKFYLSLANQWMLTQNKAYRSNQSWEDEKKYGSRNKFHVFNKINGEYFRTLSNNQYYRIVDKHADPKSFRYFWPSIWIQGKVVDPKTQKLLRLEIVRNKGYWIEGDQSIELEIGVEPDVVVVETPIDDLVIPEFVPVPDY